MKNFDLGFGLGAAVALAVGAWIVFCSDSPAPPKQQTIETDIPVTETVCVEATENYCKRYETRRILRE